MSLESQVPQHPRSVESAEKLKTITYRLESGVTVEIRSRTFVAPTHGEHPQGSSVIFLPGWSMNADAKNIEQLCTAYAEDPGIASSNSITTRSEERGGRDEHPDLFYEEARAIAKYIKEVLKLKEVILSGHSQGGDKAIHLAEILQKDPEVTIKGIVLIDPVGLYEQTPLELTKTFIGNAIVTPFKLGASGEKVISTYVRGVANAMKAGRVVVRNNLKEMARSKLSWWRRFESEVTEMGKRNPNTREIRVPIVIVTGLNDSVSDSDKILPAVEPTLGAREQHLRETLFPNAPSVEMRVPKKMGVHTLPFLRGRAVARTTLEMLKRRAK